MSYRLIVMDPPWGTDRGGGGRGAQEHYQLARAGDEWRIVMMSGAFRPHEDGCLVWCWCTALSRHLVPTLFERLGVRDTGCEMVWCKGEVVLLAEQREPGTVVHRAELVQQVGLGQYVMTGHEYARLGVVGRVPTPVPYRPMSWLLSKRGRHSAKPDEAYAEWLEMARALWPDEDLRAIELFARDARPGWEAWGNEAPAAPVEA